MGWGGAVEAGIRLIQAAMEKFLPESGEKSSRLRLKAEEKFKEWLSKSEAPSKKRNEDSARDDVP